ncbi:MAG: nitroreductase family protein [Proteobacteria bacterium]|nr:nitroreductase family protein [Pseudomonadota bacterium]MBU1737424.1 nitroreductase family protein [Pseudomonadota bacterium]
MSKTVQKHPVRLSVEEREVLQRIPSFLRGLFTAFWMMKRRLQFTGWLQYLIPMFLSLPFLAIGLPLYFFAHLWASLPFLVPAGLLLLAAVLDILTVKWHIQFPERCPRRNDGLDLFDVMRARHSCRSFQTGRISDEDREALCASAKAHLAEPKFGDGPIRLEYIAGPVTVWPPVNAREFFIAIAPKEYDRRAVMDVGRTLQHVVMDATRMGIGTCWIGQGADHASIIKLLGDRFDPAQDNIICVCAIGYASRYIPAFIRFFNAKFSNRRYPFNALFFTDPACTKPLDTTTAPFDRLGRTYEICQWAPSAYNGQTTRCAAVTDNATVIRFDFFAATMSRYYAAVAVGIWTANWEMGCQAQRITGRWEFLDPTTVEAGELPRYDISWLLDPPLDA